jgi:hypothetical protein
MPGTGFVASWALGRPVPPAAGAGPVPVDADADAGDTAGEIRGRPCASTVDLPVASSQQAAAQMSNVRAAFMDGGVIDWVR